MPPPVCVAFPVGCCPGAPPFQHLPALRPLPTELQPTVTLPFADFPAYTGWASQGPSDAALLASVGSSIRARGAAPPAPMPLSAPAGRPRMAAGRGAPGGAPRPAMAMAAQKMAAPMAAAACAIGFKTGGSGSAAWGSAAWDGPAFEFFVDGSVQLVFVSEDHRLTQFPSPSCALKRSVIFPAPIRPPVRHFRPRPDAPNPSSAASSPVPPRPRRRRPGCRQLPREYQAGPPAGAL